MFRVTDRIETAHVEDTVESAFVTARLDYGQGVHISLCEASS